MAYEREIMAEKKDYNPGNPDEGEGVAMLERMNHAHQYLRELAFPLIPWREGMRILDVGCGGGETIHQMLGKSEGSVIDGVDYAKTSLKISSKVNAHELGKRVFLHRADVAKLPFDDDVFDLVTAMETTYFWPDILAAFSEIRRVLKKGGLFAIILEAVTPGIHDDWSIPGVDIRIRSADEIRELLVKAGFSSVSVHRGEEDSAVILAIEAEE